MTCRVIRFASLSLRARLLLAAVCTLVAILGGSQVRGQESTPEAQQAFSDAATFQNNKAYDVAIEEWEKFLKNHGSDPLAAKAQHYLGACRAQLKQFDKAVEAFAAVAKKYPKFDLLEETLFNLGSCRYSLAASGKEGLHAQAAEAFADLLKQFPKGKYASEAAYFQGESLYASGKKEESLAAYDKLVTDYPESPRRADALYALGATREELGQFEAAGKSYDLFLKEFASSPLALEVRMRKAETVLQAKDYPAAEKMFAEVAAVKDFPFADNALMRQAFCLVKQDKFAPAGKLYAQVATDFPKSSSVATATLEAARTYYRAGDALAADWLQKAIDLKNENSPEAAHWQCVLLLKAKKFSEAEKLAAQFIASGAKSEYLPNLKFDEADALNDQPEKKAAAYAKYLAFAKDYPENALAPQALYFAAFAALELKNYDDAVQQAAAFMEKHAAHNLAPDVQYVSAESLLQLKKHPEAEKGFRALVDKQASHADIDAWRLRLGLTLYLQQKYADVASLLSPLAAGFKTAEQQAEGLYLVGASEFLQEKFAPAEKALSASLAKSDSWRQADEALMFLARAQAKISQPKEAEKSLTKLIKDFPQSQLLDQAHYRLGELRFAQDDFAAAGAEYETVLKNWPESIFAPYALFGDGWRKLRQKDAKAAAAAFTSLLDKHEGHALTADAHYARAMARRQAQDFPGAIADADAFLKTKPTGDRQSDALFEKGLAQVALNQFPPAAETFTTLLKENDKYPGVDKVRYELAWALKSQDKHPEAAEQFAALAKEKADSPFAAEALFHVGEDQYGKKDYAAAAQTYQQSVDKKPTGELLEKTLHKLGWAQFQQKQYAPAAKSFSAQIAAAGGGPLAGDAAFMQAECLFRDEKFDEAWPAYQALASGQNKVKVSSPVMEALALLHGGQSAAQLKKWKESLEMLQQLPTKFPESPYLAEAYYEAGWARQNSGKAEEALADYESAASKSRDHVGARARFMMGEIFFEQKKHVEAIREFQRAMFGFGGDAATAETKTWQAKAAFEAGRCAEVQLGAATDSDTKQMRLADAIRFYTQLVEKHPQDSLAGDAKKRLAELAKLK